MASKSSLSPFPFSLRFLQEFDTGSGDYTRDRGKWLKRLRVHDAVEEIKKRRKEGSEPQAEPQ